MAVTYPPIFTPILDAEVNVNVPVTEETVRKFIQNINFISLLAPVGAVNAIALNIPQTPTPDANLFQYCDGTEITNGTSPLRSSGTAVHNTVNLQGQFVRCAFAENANNMVGQLTVDFNHNHSGTTGAHYQDYDPKSGSDWAGGGPGHTHGIETDLVHANTDYPASTTDANATQLDPWHYNVAFYLKIN